MPEKPRQEITVALAGPLVNVAFAALTLAVLLLLGWPIGSPSSYFTTSFSAGGDAAANNALIQFMWLNATLAAFNLLPAFPMDGGRILRAVLQAALNGDRARATWYAAVVGRTFAIVLGVVGLLWSPILVIIALFVWAGGGADAAVEEQRVLLRDVTVGDAARYDAVFLPASAPLSQAKEALSAGRVVVVAANEEEARSQPRVGVVTATNVAALFAGLHRRGSAKHGFRRSPRLGFASGSRN